MLHLVLNIDWSEHIIKRHLYHGILRLNNKVASRRMKLASHYHRHRELPARQGAVRAHTRAPIDRALHT